MRGRPLRLLLIAGVLGAFALAVTVLHGPIIATGLAWAGRLAGYNVRYDGLSFDRGHVVIAHPDVSSLGGEPVFTAQTLDIAYDSRTLLRGPHFYGISGIEIDRPKFTLIHHRDGSYNVNLPKSNPGAKSAPFVLPQIYVIVRNGTIGILDDTRIFRHSRRFAIENVQADVDVDPHALSRFVAGATLVEDGGTFPIVGRGRFDPARGYELSHVTARRVALAPLLDYALNSPSLHIANGVLNDVDARVYGLLDRAGTIERHVSVTAKLDHFQPYLNSLAKPLRDGRGTIRVYDAGLAIPKVDGSIAGVPVRIAGGIFDLAHPTLRLGISGNGDLAQLLTLSDAVKRLPLRGPLGFRLFVEGDATAPQTLASFRSARLFYDRVPIDDVHGLVALHGAETAIVRSALRYGGIDVGARGRVLSVGKHTNVELVAALGAPAARLPYARGIVGDMLLQGTAVVRGVDARLAATGTVYGDTPAQHLGGTFALDGRGVGTIGPLALTGPGDQELIAQVQLDRPGFRSGAAFVAARQFRFTTAGVQPSLPAMALVPLPAADGTLDANFAGAFNDRRFVVGGDARLRDAHVLGYPIEDAQARARVDDGRRVAVDARYRGSLSALARATGRATLVRGRADIPFSVVATSATDALVSIGGARFTNASIGGVALQGLSATLGVRGRAYDVYAARATLDGNDIVAQGSFGDGGTVAVSASDVELAAFRGLGLPVRAGRLTALADVSGSLAAPRVEGGVAVAGVPVPGPLAAWPAVDANAGLTYAHDRLALRDGLVRAGAAVASLDGTVAGLQGSPGATRYDLDAHVRQADIATLARVAKAPLRYPEGSLDADLRVAGAGASPAVRGRIAIPEGALNGLRFRNAVVGLAGTPAALRASGGSLTVGSSTVGFDAALSAGSQTIALRAPRVDLADFNDYFDRGDTLGGRGSIAISARNAPNAVVTGGRLRLAHARLRRFDFGDARADWSTRGRTVRLDTALGGEAGRLTTAGYVELAATQPLRDALHRTNVALATRARGIDLAVWLPAAGVQAPVLGRIDADARARGAFPAIAVDARASLLGGLIGRVPVRTATIGVRALHGRATITDALLAIDNLRLDVRGSVGFQPRDPLALTVVAQTPDTGALAKTLTGKVLDASGSVTTTLQVLGTLARPVATDTLDARSLRYERFTLPGAHLEAALDPARVRVSRAEFDFQEGRLLASGFVPVTRGAVPSVGPATSPVALDLRVEHMTLGQFAALLPKGTQAAGTLDGRVNVGGSIAAPTLGGTLALANGNFVGPQLRSRLTNATAQLTFAGTSAILQDARATVGGGTLSASGRASVTSLRQPGRDLAYALQLHSDNAVLDAPQYLRGRVNGSLALTRSAGRTPVLSGDLALSSTRVALAAIFNPNAPTPTASASPLDLALDFGVDVGRDVRVQGGPVDIGAQGNLRVGGTLAAPTASGELDSTGGTLSFYRTFRLQYPSTVEFDPSNGVIPNVDAVATTTVDNPPTDVTLHVTGRATQLNVALASEPNYSREQILGLLVGAQALGAVSGVQTTASNGRQQNPFQAAAEGQLGTLLTQSVLEPFSSQLGGAVGLSNLAINYSPGGSLNLGAQKKIFKNVNAVFAESFNYPPRQSLGLRASPNDATAIQLTFFSQPASNRFDTFSGNGALQSNNQSVTSSQPANGSNGFSLSFQRRF